MKPFLSILSAVLVGLASSASAQVTFTLSGTITSSDGNAFALNDAVTISFTTTSDIGAPNETNIANGAEWNLFNGNTNPLWSDITISGAAGTYATPIVSENYAILSSTPDSPFYISNDTGSATTGLGLTWGSEDLWYVDASVSPVGTFATYPGDATTRPETVFYNGTYAVTNDGTSYIFTDDYDFTYTIEYSSLTISGAQTVPEPTSPALLLVGGVVLLSYWRPRRV